MAEDRAEAAPSAAGDPPPEVTSEEDAADYLYGLEPSDFVAARNLLVRSLRAAGNRPLADTVKAWRRPNVMAAELNRILRARSDGLDALFRAADELRRGQQQAMAGEAVDMPALRSAHRRAAASLAGDARRDGEQIQVALERASLDQEHHAQLRAAAYTTGPEPAAGFDLLQPVPGARPSHTRPIPEAAAGPEQMAATAAQPAPLSEPPGTRFAADRQQRGETRRSDAAAAVAIARRRLSAAIESEEAAARRLEEQRQRLAAAERHLDETRERTRAAREALARAEEHLG